MEIQINQSEIQYLQKKLLGWGRKNYREFPWRNLSNQWHALVVEIMLQRTKADQVEPVFREFVKQFPKPEDYLANPVNVFNHLGLPERNILLKALAQRIVDGSIPENREQLLTLPGVGDYIASAFRSFHIGITDTIIDSNVVRLYSRFFGFASDGETRRKKWFIHLAEKLTPVKRHRDYNYALLDFTRDICSRKPKCNICPLQEKCIYAQSRWWQSDI